MSFVSLTVDKGLTMLSKFNSLEQSFIVLVSSWVILGLFAIQGWGSPWSFWGPIFVCLIDIPLSGLDNSFSKRLAYKPSYIIRGGATIAALMVLSVISFAAAGADADIFIPPVLGGWLVPMSIYTFFKDVPSHTNKKLTHLAQSEMRMKEAALRLSQSDGSAPFKNDFVDAARNFYALLRGGIITIYDEQRIANDLQQFMPSIPPALNISGDYRDNRLINNITNNISHQDEELLTRESVQRACLKAIRSQGKEGSTLLRLVEEVRAPKAQILLAIEHLQQDDLVHIDNREDGAIVYRLNELS